jgi:hypothetical protein
MDRTLTIVAYGWLAIVLILNLAGIAGIAMQADGFWDGWTRIGDVYSPFNVWTHLLNVGLALPAIGLIVWRDKRRGA